MKKLLLFVLLMSITSYGQIPSGYYDSATGTGYALKSQLSSIISNGHIDRGYSALYGGYQSTDSDLYYEGDNTVLDMYSENPTGEDPYNYNHGSNNCGNYSAESDCYNREHLFPQGTFDKQVPMRTDIHHVVPSDGKVNGQRNNYPFGEVSSPTWTSLNGSKRGPNITPGYSGTVFEPIDEFKGDIARCMLYFATRYESQIDGWSHDMLNGTENQAYADWFITLLVKWHTNDPVSTRETARNNAAYVYQGNRNPYIDHPEYVNMIWSAFATTPDTEIPSTPTNLVASNITNTTVDLNWTASTDNISVSSYDIFIDGALYTTSTTNSKVVTGLTQNTNYDATVYAKDPSGNLSLVSNTENFTTTNVIDITPPSAITDLVSSNVTSTSANLSWTPATDNVAVTLYEIYKDGSLIGTSPTNSYAVSNLTPETSYDFTVYAKDAANNTSAVSNTETITTSAATSDCGTETFANATSLPSGGYDDGSFIGVNDITWSYTESRDAYDNGNEINGQSLMLRNTTSSLTSSTISGGIGSFTCNLKKAFTGGGDRQVELFINDVSQGISIAWDNTSLQTFTVSNINISDDIVIKIVPTTGKQVTIDDITWTCYSTLSTNDFDKNLFSVYPNPTKNNKVIISSPNNDELKSIEFYSITGQLIKQLSNPKLTNNKISIDYIPSGMYIVKIESDSAYSTKRLIVQ
ncbi:Por secretion system C-terminal sorting domain-containing protein [Lutibacter oricola]|uniref:Por secretion system C-terminal sorting domain-containing protein n=1 Tax=Lutibacter oricola TaxID=762486 RepID=A0A1H2XWM2_9FLAO|nr:endonuclease [Lutibacter oricola]SDW97227.1 Por secretion system C-terminal sorting domain-containing protein [Lutibacter oricola]